MESRVHHRIVVNTAGFLLASFGFFLSVFAVLVSLLTSIIFVESAKSPSFDILAKRRAARLSQTLKRSPEIPSYTPEGAEPAISILRVEPSITEGNPTSITFLHGAEASILPPTESAVLEFVEVPSEFEESRLHQEEVHSSFKLSNLWGEKRLKPLQRCVSSPHLVNTRSRAELRKPLPLGKRSKPFYKEIFDNSNPPCSSSSLTITEKKHLEKKKSQTLRTQPYEAPYFFPPPTSLTAEFGAPKRPNPVRSRTMPSESRSTSLSVMSGSQSGIQATILSVST